MLNRMQYFHILVKLLFNIDICVNIAFIWRYIFSASLNNQSMFTRLCIINSKTPIMFLIEKIKNYFDAAFAAN